MFVCVRETHSFAGGVEVLLDEGQRDGDESLPGDPLPHCAAVIIILLQNKEETLRHVSGVLTSHFHLTTVIKMCHLIVLSDILTLSTLCLAFSMAELALLGLSGLSWTAL